MQEAGLQGEADEGTCSFAAAASGLPAVAEVAVLTAVLLAAALAAKVLAGN